jgi:hypothetical protein
MRPPGGSERFDAGIPAYRDGLPASAAASAAAAPGESAAEGPARELPPLLPDQDDPEEELLTVCLAMVVVAIEPRALEKAAESKAPAETNQSGAASP